MVDVRVDHSLIEQALQTFSRYVYLDDLRMSQRAPLLELQRIARAATVEQTVTDTSVMVCTGCGFRMDECPECNGTESANPTTTDAAAMAAALSAPLDATVIECDATEDNPDPRCRCQRCHQARVRQEADRLRQQQERRVQRRQDRQRRENRPDCRECGYYAPNHTELARHITDHARHCGLCGWYNVDHGTSYEDETRRRHMLDYHLLCDSLHDGGDGECGLWFRTVAALRSHENGDAPIPDESAPQPRARRTLTDDMWRNLTVPRRTPRVPTLTVDFDDDSGGPEVAITYDEVAFDPRPVAAAPRRTYRMN